MYEAEKDAERHIIEKLGQWITDSFARCELADIRKSTAIAIIMRALLYAFIIGLMRKGANKEDMLKVFSNNWDMMKDVQEKRGLK